MSETSLNAIGNIKPIDPNTNSVTLTQAQSAATSPPKTNVVNSEKLQVQAKGGNTQAETLSNVSIHFRVDHKTNEVTIFIIDRKSRKVLRSIPANELEKLQIGELLKLTA